MRESEGARLSWHSRWDKPPLQKNGFKLLSKRLANPCNLAFKFLSSCFLELLALLSSFWRFEVVERCRIMATSFFV